MLGRVGRPRERRGLAHLKRLDLRNTRVTAPEGCPKGTDQYGNPALVYPRTRWGLLESNPLRAALLRKKRRRQKAEERGTGEGPSMRQAGLDRGDGGQLRVWRWGFFVVRRNAVSLVTSKKDAHA